MIKTITSLINEARTKQEFWQDTARDAEALEDRNKTKEEAIILANYFEGKFDGLCEARKFVTL